ncbi:MAG: BamA/TamA family outer membrane protein [Acidobacteriota bacterium]|nr:BamA/TamA family outer membrane protein [Acidobacteriota bacterium]
MRFPGPFAPFSLLLLAIPQLFAGQAFLRQVAETNVNHRYVVESVSVAGVEVDQLAPSRLPRSLRQRLKSLVGAQCDVAMLEELSSQIRREMHLRTVSEHLSRGSAPDRIRVNFEVVRRDLGFDVSLPKFLYHSKQGFTGEIDASTSLKQNNFAFAVVSNGDDLTERFAGLTARFDSAPIVSDKVRLGVTVEDYHEQWNDTTRSAAAGSALDLYRSRWNVAPEVTFAVARSLGTSPLTVSFGASFEGTNSESRTAGGRSANSATLDVHYGRRIEGDSVQQSIEGKYSLRVATHALGSTYAYTRHLISAKYEARSGRHTVTDQFLGGSIAGWAPFFDCFVLGSSSTLRGWDRYEIDPLGGSRVVHNELAYGYRVSQGTLEGFYDSGALWGAGRSARLRHSLGGGYKQGIFVLTVAFPVRSGRIEPVFMAGMNY